MAIERFPVRKKGMTDLVSDRHTLTLENGEGRKEGKNLVSLQYNNLRRKKEGLKKQRVDR